MTMLESLYSAAAIGSIAVQATAQARTDSVPQPIYGKPAYGYDGNSVDKTIGQLLGGRYSIPDRDAVKQCVSAAMQQAAVQYQPEPTGDAHPYGQGYNPAALMRLTAISDVTRRRNALHISGLIDSRIGHAYYGYDNAYQNNGYVSAGYLSFRCEIDDSGIVFNLRVQRAASPTS